MLTLLRDCGFTRPCIIGYEFSSSRCTALGRASVEREASGSGTGRYSPPHWLKNEECECGDCQVHSRRKDKDPIPAACAILDHARKWHHPHRHSLCNVEQTRVGRGICCALGVSRDRGKQAEDFAPCEENQASEHDEHIRCVPECAKPPIGDGSDREYYSNGDLAAD